MLKIQLPQRNAKIDLEIVEETPVQEILESIQEEINIDKNIKYWTCFSLTQNKVLNHQEKLKAKQNEELYIYFEFKNNFSDIYVSKEKDYKQYTSDSQISTDRQTFRQSTDRHDFNQTDLLFQNKKIVFLDDIKQIIEMDGNTSVKELLEYLAKENKIEIKKIFNWSCFSETQNRKLNLEEKVGFQSNETLQIKTNKLQHAQSTKSLGQYQGNQKQNILQQQQHYYDSPEFLFCSKTITLTIAVYDNIYTRNLTAMFLLDQTIEYIAQDVLSFSSLTIDQVSVDIFINDRQFNNPDKRALTIYEANLNRDSKIVAKIRWIN